MARTYVSTHGQQMTFVGTRNGRLVFQQESSSTPGTFNEMTCEPNGTYAVCDCKYHSFSHRACGAMKNAAMLAASVNQKEQA